MTLDRVMKTAVTLGLYAGLSVVAIAQQPQAEKPKEQQRQRSDAASMTGCLAKGAKADQYVLTDKAGTKTTVTGSAAANLEKHAGHTVELTGSKGSDGNFVATNVRHIAATCEAAK